MALLAFQRISVRNDNINLSNHVELSVVSYYVINVKFICKSVRTRIICMFAIYCKSMMIIGRKHGHVFTVVWTEICCEKEDVFSYFQYVHVR